MDVCVYTLGCKVNQYESGVIVANLKSAGFNAFEGLARADIFILNTCAVTSEAEKKSRQAVAKMVKLNPSCKIFIVGCASQNNAAQFEKFDNVKFVKGVAAKTDIVSVLQKEGVDVAPLPAKYEETPFAEICKTRQTIKIQDGCNNFCSYCLIPYLRGRSRSRNEKDIFCEAQKCAKNVHEIVLTGIDISSYGKDTGTDLGSLAEKLCFDGVRIRLGSLEVGVITEEFLTKLKNNKNFCPHFHLSLQSGSDKVLRVMNRHYTTEQYLEKVRLIRRFFPDAGITTDVIVGFPAEDEDAFAETCDFVKKVGFSDIHVFPFSSRKGTAAAKLPQVKDEIKKSRVEKLTEIKMQLKKAFLSQFVGKTAEVLFEEIDGEFISGYTANYAKVFLKRGEVEENALNKVKINRLFNDGLFGEVSK